ncbi:class I SAM-dependent methyltransferase [Candidatus Woesearchaeota archaeon]|nr:class I SAM-dependent methyltransferase [Candidatus Woesearchaeota archaeon]
MSNTNSVHPHQDQTQEYNLDKVKAFYKKHVQKYPEGDIRTMGWHDQDEYAIRFKVMTAIADLNNTTILDVGCGIGGLYGYLISQGIHTQFTGVDILPEMIEHAKRRFPVATTTAAFKVCNILKEELPQYDYVFCIGALNISSEGFDMFFRSMIKKMIQLAKKGVGLNFLCNKEKLSAGPYHFENPQTLKEELEAEYNVRIEMDVEKSLDGECCLFIYKKE